MQFSIALVFNVGLALRCFEAIRRQLRFNAGICFSIMFLTYRYCSRDFLLRDQMQVLLMNNIDTHTFVNRYLVNFEQGVFFFLWGGGGISFYIVVEIRA